METQFFTWTEWDEQDTSSFTFYDCKLIDGVLPELSVREFPCCFVDYCKGKMEFYDSDNKVVATYELKMTAKPLEKK